MYHLFESARAHVAYEARTLSGIELIQRTYLRDMHKALSWYREKYIPVVSNHLLCKLINMCVSRVDMPLSEYYAIVRARAPYVAKHLRFFAANNAGDVLSDGAGITCSKTPDLIFHEDSHTSVSVDWSVDRQWVHLKSIRCLETSQTAMSYTVPTEPHRQFGSNTDYRMYSINIPRLMVQYYYFAKEQQLVYENPTSSKVKSGITHFVHMYVLPQLLPDLLNLSVINRLDALYRGKPMDDVYRKPVFAVTDYTSGLDEALLKYLDYLTNRRSPYGAYLRSIPGITSRTCEKALVMPSISPTRQVWWALLTTRIRVMSLLYRLGQEQGSSANAHDLNSLRLDVKHLQKDNVIAAYIGSATSTPEGRLWQTARVYYDEIGYAA